MLLLVLSPAPTFLLTVFVEQVLEYHVSAGMLKITRQNGEPFRGQIFNMNIITFTSMNRIHVLSNSILLYPLSPGLLAFVVVEDKLADSLGLLRVFNGGLMGRPLTYFNLTYAVQSNRCSWSC
jgi:hypothetical protein